ncbi:hypothetical protein HOU04_gp167 [Synechococcus phage S-T4]|jgi:hypothetical protein|uniref:Uncharacterized protein n=1 Tax=Synechococcus phage S-T4 TaxID=2268578 RepID=A0A385EFP9_9CAUD|nr:hypothetical protein HOU04_gp167 [Synechococcus phage S-T4]AXQ70566.1 hypothetical protein [Synechococcus phage S-T4]
MLIRKTGKEEGAYAVFNKNYEKVLFLFEDEDDASRYAMMLEDQNENQDLSVETVKVDPDMAIKTCHIKGINYTIITPNDFVIPPKN